jgi:hypothetical protein
MFYFWINFTNVNHNKGKEGWAQRAPLFYAFLHQFFQEYTILKH